MGTKLMVVQGVLILGVAFLRGADVSFSQEEAPPTPYEVKKSPLPQGNHGIAARIWSLPVSGRLWSFSVADYLIVDDFEDYTDDVGSRVFQTWRDGWDFSEPRRAIPATAPARL